MVTEEKREAFSKEKLLPCGNVFFVLFCKYMPLLFYQRDLMRYPSVRVIRRWKRIDIELYYVVGRMRITALWYNLCLLLVLVVFCYRPIAWIYTRGSYSLGS